MRILIANPFGIGDVLFSLPLVYALREAYPKGFLGYLSNRRTQELVSACFFVDRRLVFEKDEFRTAWGRSKRAGAQLLWNLIRSIQQLRFDVLVDLSLGWHYGLAAQLAGIPKRVGFDFRERGRFLTDRLPILGFHDQPVAEYYLDLLPFLGLSKPHPLRSGLELPATVLPQAQAYLKSHGIHRHPRLVGMVPGGGASWGPRAVFKQWSPQAFAQVADHVGQRYAAHVLLIGDTQETSLCQTVAQAMKSKPTCVVDVSSLLLLAGLLQRCTLVIGNDGGPMHLAASVGVKTVTLFGPVDAAVYRPLPNGTSHRVVAKGLACRPCYQRFRFPPCPWDNACLKQLTATEVIEVVDQQLR